MIRKLTDRISVLPASSNPLSADVGIVRGKKEIYIYDVGAGDEAWMTLENLSAPKNIVLSHFHNDHMGNLSRMTCRRVYGGRETIKHLPTLNCNCSKTQPVFYADSVQRETICVEAPVSIEDGGRIDIVPMPSTHAKGSLVMCVDEEYTFLGDAIYTAVIKGQPCYNVQLLKSQLEVLAALNSRYFFLSHDEQFVYEKQELLDFLKRIYDSRRKNEAYIYTR